MQNSKLIQVLKTLSATEMRSLEKFLRSPFFNQQAILVTLFLYLEKGLKKKTVAFSLEEISAFIFPEEPFQPKKVHHIKNYLLEQIEQWLAIKEWQHDIKNTNLYVAKAYRERNLEKPFQSLSKATHKRIEKENLRDGNYYQFNYLWQLEKLHQSQQQGRAKSFNLQQLSDNQDIAFICEKLKNGCLLLSHQTVAKQTYDTGLLQHTLDFLKNHVYLDIPAVAIYYHGYYALLGEAAEFHFQKLKLLLAQYGHQFSAEERRNIYLMAVNFCIRRLNYSEVNYFREVFDLYKAGLADGAFLENGALSRWTYNNMAITGVQLEEYDWVYQFLHDYRPFLEKKHREATFSFNLAKYFYAIKDFPNAMQHLQKMEYDDILHNVMAKVLLCKMYYELDEWDAMENLLDSIQIYIRRKKVLGYHKQNYTNIVRFMRRLLTVNLFDKTEKAALQETIIAAQPLTERAWLLGQL